jgi:DNA-binding HxlR family transcriptional regulator
MPNRIWQAEEEKWEKRLKRAEKALTFIRGLRQLEAEEEAEEQSSKLAGRPAEPAGQVQARADSTTAPVPPPRDDRGIPPAEQPQPPKKTAKDVIPELLRGGPMTIKAMAEAAQRSQQAIANALAELKEGNVVKEEPSTLPGFRFQYRLTTPEERGRIALITDYSLDQEEDQESD